MRHFRYVPRINLAWRTLWLSHSYLHPPGLSRKRFSASKFAHEEKLFSFAAQSKGQDILTLIEVCCIMTS